MKLDLFKNVISNFFGGVILNAFVHIPIVRFRLSSYMIMSLMGYIGSGGLVITYITVPYFMRHEPKREIYQMLPTYIGCVLSFYLTERYITPSLV